MANRVRQEILHMEQEHERRTEAERAAQRANVERFADRLERANQEFDAAGRRANEAVVDHMAAINRLKSQDDERNRERNAIHMENVKETKKANARELDTLRNANESDEKNLIEYQSAEKNRAEESRRQLNQEATARIAMEMAETARARELAQQQETDRTKFKHDIEQKNLAEVKGMKDVLLENTRLENERRVHHALTLDHIKKTGVVCESKMEVAKQLQNQNRSARELIDDVSSELNGLYRKLADISGKIAVAAKHEDPKILKRNGVMIARNLAAIRSSCISLTEHLGSLQQQTVDEKDVERNVVYNVIIEELVKMAEFHSTLQTLLPREHDELELNMLASIAEATVEAKETVEMIKRHWSQLPPVDRTNLVHAQYLEITGDLLKGGSTLAVDVEKLKILEIESRAEQEEGEKDD